MARKRPVRRRLLPRAAAIEITLAGGRVVRVSPGFDPVTLERKLDARNKELETAATERVEANERLKRDLEAAARVQQAFLPAVLPEVPGVRLAWTFRPCGRLAGAFLNVFRLGDRHVRLCVLDINGHGVSAALLSVTASHLLAQMSNPPLPVTGRCGQGAPGAAIGPPAQVAGELSKQLSGVDAAGQTFTLLYGILGLDTRELCFVSAGHPGPVHLPLGSPPVVLQGSGFPVGIGMANCRAQVIKLEPGDRLVLYSDGITEARNADGELFGSRRLLAALEQTCHRPLGESLNALLENVEAWPGNSPPHDDLAILGAEIAAPEMLAGRAAVEPA